MYNINTQIRVFRRANGSIGIRNHILVISTVACANFVASSIAARVPGAVACTHSYGCDQIGESADLTLRVLTNIGQNANVAAVLVVGLGCEQISAEYLAKKISLSKKQTKVVTIQEEGGTTKSIARGITYCNYMKSKMSQDRVIASLNKLIIGIECGGSDYTSGIAANPAVGAVVDFLVSLGVRVLFGETTEIIGAEHILVKRATSIKVKKFILSKVQKIEEMAKKMKVDIRGSNPSPGNIHGGISSIEEKSLGAICKIGKSLIVDGIEFADKPKMSGLSFMDTPGNDLACTCGLVAGGANMMLFTTGRGTPMGFSIAPVLKITANKDVAYKMAENIDIDLSSIILGKMSINNAGKIILDKIIAVAEDEKVKAEKLGHQEFGFHSIGPTL